MRFTPEVAANREASVLLPVEHVGQVGVPLVTMLVGSRKFGSLAFLLAILASRGMAAEPPDLRLVAAARAQDAAAVRSLLVDQQVPVHVAQPDGATALHWAAHWDDQPVADLLIRAGADVNATNELGVAPLSLACTNGSAAMVETLLERGANPNRALPTGVTPLMTCARSGNVDAVQHLLARGARVNETETVRGQTALMWAIAEKHTGVAAALVAAGADVRARSHGEFTPLLFAAQQGTLGSARLLLDDDVDVNGVGGDGSAALLVATESGHHDMVQFLLDAGADPNAIGTGRTALHAAVQHERPDIVALLLSHGADPNARLRRRLPRFAGDLSSTSGPLSTIGATPFWLAAQFTDLPLMRLLADRGADPRLPSDDGTTPLLVAAGIGYVDGYDRYGRLRFDGDVASREANDLEAVQLAVSLGGDVSVVNEHGQTAVHGIAYLGAASILRYLADQGARLDVIDQDGRTPLSIAEGMYIAGAFVVQENTAAALREFGAERSGQR